MKTTTVAFVSHKRIENYIQFTKKLKALLSSLIEEENAETFLLTDKSFFDCLCLEALTDLKRYYPLIKRVHISAMYDRVNYDLLRRYDELFIPEKGANYGIYGKYYKIMVDKCDILVTYCDGDYRLLKGRAAATKNAIAYALNKNKRIINLAEY